MTTQCLISKIYYNGGDNLKVRRWEIIKELLKYDYTVRRIENRCTIARKKYNNGYVEEIKINHINNNADIYQRLFDGAHIVKFNYVENLSYNEEIMDWIDSHMYDFDSGYF